MYVRKGEKEKERDHRCINVHGKFNTLCGGAVNMDLYIKFSI